MSLLSRKRRNPQAVPPPVPVQKEKKVDTPKSVSDEVSNLAEKKRFMDSSDEGEGSTEVMKKELVKNADDLSSSGEWREIEKCLRGEDGDSMENFISTIPDSVIPLKKDLSFIENDPAQVPSTSTSAKVMSSTVNSKDISSPISNSEQTDQIKVQSGSISLAEFAFVRPKSFPFPAKSSNEFQIKPKPNKLIKPSTGKEVTVQVPSKPITAPDPPPKQYQIIEPIFCFTRTSDKAFAPTPNPVLGYDIKSAYDFTVPKLDSVIAKTDLHITLPPGYMGRTGQPSGINARKYINVEVGEFDGEIKSDLLIRLSNDSSKDVFFKRGEIVARLFCVKVYSPEMVEIINED